MDPFFILPSFSRVSDEILSGVTTTLAIQGLYCHYCKSKAQSYKFANSISISPNGWTDQELGSAWLQNDFDPATQNKAAGQYRLLILDSHNLHCTFTFCKYAADHKIIIICLPLHTTHALQPCNVGAFGPLAQSWKREVTCTSQSLIAIRKDNLLVHYHAACISALKTMTIQSAF
jgi:hypothetical protein